MTACVAHAAQGEKATAQRDHIAQLCEQTGKCPEELGLAIPEDILPSIPPAGEQLWSWFWELDKGRQSNGFSEQAFAWADMQAWAQLTSTTLMPWQALALRQMDAAYIAACAQQKKE